MKLAVLEKTEEGEATVTREAKGIHTFSEGTTECKRNACMVANLPIEHSNIQECESFVWVHHILLV